MSIFNHEVANGLMSAHGQRMLASALFSDGVTLPSLWLGLLVASPELTDDGESVDEVPVEVVDPDTFVVSDTGYERIFVPPSTASGTPLWTPKGKGQVVYTSSLEFAEAKFRWGYITNWAMFTEKTGGALIATGPAGLDVNGPPGVRNLDEDLEDPQDLTGDVVVIPEEGLVFEVWGG